MLDGTTFPLVSLNCLVCASYSSPLFRLTFMNETLRRVDTGARERLKVLLDYIPPACLAN